jgi:four helix bundle protein
VANAEDESAFFGRSFSQNRSFPKGRKAIFPAVAAAAQVSRKFPGEERFGLTNQMRRAAVSISSNLAEGSSRVSRTDFARFVEIATGSLFEIVSQTTIALRRKMITENDYNRIYAAAEKQSKMLSGLRRSLSES